MGHEKQQAPSRKPVYFLAELSSQEKENSRPEREQRGQHREEGDPRHEIVQPRKQEEQDHKPGRNGFRHAHDSISFVVLGLTVPP